MFRILAIIVLLFSTHFSWAQEANQNNNLIQRYGPRRQISTIVYMGLAGAVLGLSTLSFYGRPQDKLTNIPIGFGIGVVIGTIYMTYQAAANPDEFYRDARYIPHFTQQKSKNKMATDLYYQAEGPDVSYRWTF